MRSWMYCPGDSPGKMINAGIYGADGLVLDLEDAVGEEDKDAARILVSEALKGYDFGASVLAVRINAVGTPWWEDDLRAVVPAGARIIRLPKAEQAETVRQVSSFLEALEKEDGLMPGNVKLQCILETPLGVEEVFSIAGATPRVQSLSFGAEDYCTTMGIRRDGPEYALDYPRSRIAAAAAAHGIASYDTVWSAYEDIEGLRRDAERARSLGFNGKSVIHPGQIDVVNEVFSYSVEEIAWARKIVAHVGEAGGVTTVDGAMVDAPVVKRAQRILAAGEKPHE